MSILNKFATLGKALMLPIAVMPVAGLLLRLGAGDLLGRFFDASFIAAAGNAIFAHLPLIFGIGIAVGLAKQNHGAAALAAAVSYFVLIGVMTSLAHTLYMSPISDLQTAIYDKLILGKSTINLVPLIHSTGDIPASITGSYLNSIQFVDYHNSTMTDGTTHTLQEILASGNVVNVADSISYMFTQKASIYNEHLLSSVTGAINNLKNVQTSATLASALDPQTIVDTIVNGGKQSTELAQKVAYIGVKSTQTAIMSDISGVLAEKKLDMGVLGGIIAGLVGAFAYNRFHTTKLPDVLAFFSGRRLSPIMAGLISLIIGVIAAFIWGHIQDLIAMLADALVSMGWFGSFIYGVLNRLLLSLGLHNVMNVYFWFNLGDYVNAQGLTVHGDLTRFFAGDQTAGNFMAGFFPVMMFGLPGAGLAMYLNAKAENKKEVGGLLLSVCFTAFLTGITEPIEYLFMFIAPMLYFFHAIFMGISLALSNMLDYHMGFGFSGGAFDALLNYNAPAAHHPWMLFILGPIFFLAYFIVFFFAIRIFNIRTPGREEEGQNATQQAFSSLSDVEKAQAYIEALGGLSNIESVDNCITRLRLDLKSIDEIDVGAIKNMDNKGIVRPGGNSLQIIIGSQVEFVANAMREIQNGLVVPPTNTGATAFANSSKKVVYSDAKEITILAPVEGIVVDLSDVPDPTFSERIVGDGIAIQPTGNRICAPVSGEIISLPKECHAFMIKSDNGLEFLVHVGLETVMLRGKGFRALAKVGSRVEAGDPVLQVNWDEITDEVPSTVMPVLCSSMGATSSFTITADIGAEVNTGDKLFEMIAK